MEKKTYADKIKHSGAQKVDALFPANAKRGKTVKKSGTDLRGGK